MSLPAYPHGGLGRFEFRVPDGLGNYVYPDWDDPGLRVEFYDQEGALRFTATVVGQPALTKADDYDPIENPDGGPYVIASGIPLGNFATGEAEARVYAKVGGVEVEPYPSLVPAFVVVADEPGGPFYSTTERVRAEVPGAWPAEVTDAMVLRAIADASRRIDASLSPYYAVPFPDASDTPATPAPVEIACRLLAVEQCLVWLGRAGDGAAGIGRGEAALERLLPGDGPPRERLAGLDCPAPLYEGELCRGDLVAR